MTLQAKKVVQVLTHKNDAMGQHGLICSCVYTHKGLLQHVLRSSEVARAY